VPLLRRHRGAGWHNLSAWQQECGQAAAELTEQPGIEPGLPLPPGEVARRGKAAEIRPARRVAHEEDECVIRGRSYLDAVDRPDTRRPARPLESRRAVGVVQIGEGERFDTLRGRCGNERFRTAGGVQVGAT